MPIDTTIQVAAVSGGIAAIVTGAFTFWNLSLARKAEERRQIRALAVQVAIENWKIYKEAGDRLGGKVQPLDVFLVHAMHLVSGLDGRLTTTDQIREHLRRSLTAGAAATAEIDEHNQKIQAARTQNQPK